MEGRHERVGGRCLILEKAECGGIFILLPFYGVRLGKLGSECFSSPDLQMMCGDEKMRINGYRSVRWASGINIFLYYKQQ
jgi:hypothetical protein